MSPKDRGTIVVGIAVAILGIAGLTWNISPWPKLLLELLVFSLLCPNFSIFGGPCSSGNPLDYVVPWAIFLAVIAVVFFGVRRWIRAGKSGPR